MHSTIPALAIFTVHYESFFSKVTAVLQFVRSRCTVTEGNPASEILV